MGFKSTAVGDGDMVSQTPPPRPIYTPPAGEGLPPGPKRITEGTAQQHSLWAEIEDGVGHVIGEARAGCGKSSSQREAMFRVLTKRPSERIRYAVYSRTMADEFRPDCPSRVDVSTIHGFGMGALVKAFGSRLEKNKTYIILDGLGKTSNLPRYMRKSVALTVSAAKNQAFDPESPTLDRLDQLAEHMLHFDINGYGRDHQVCEVADKVLREAKRWTEVIDYDDMPWLPTVHDCKDLFPKIDLLFLDEVQDWNPTQHLMIESGLASKDTRIIAVGDRFQSIFAWRGADADSIPRLEQLFRADKHGFVAAPLKVTFRCPQSHVELANEFVPDLVAHPKNAEGKVGHYPQSEAQELFAPGDMVICAKNAPNVAAALRLIGQGRRAYVKGRAIGDQLLSIAKNVTDQTPRTMGDFAAGVERWRSRELNRLSSLEGVEDLIDSVNDRADGVQAVALTCQTPSDVQQSILNLFSEDVKPNEHMTVFSTIHRAKGLEASTIWLLECPMRPPKLAYEFQQARNLRYVALTRSKNVLNFVHTNA